MLFHHIYFLPTQRSLSKLKYCKNRMREMIIWQSEKIFHSLFQWIISQLGKRPHINLYPWIDSSVCVCVCIYVCVCVCVCIYVCVYAQSCQTLCDPMDCSLSVSSVRGIFHARIVEWDALSYSRDLPNPGIQHKSFASPALAGEFSLLLCHLGSHNSKFSP